MQCTTVKYLNSYVFRVLEIYLTPSTLPTDFSKKIVSDLLATTSTPNLENHGKHAHDWMIYRSATFRAVSTTNTLQLKTPTACWRTASREVSENPYPLPASGLNGQYRSHVSSQIKSASSVPFLDHFSCKPL